MIRNTYLADNRPKERNFLSCNGLGIDPLRMIRAYFYSFLKGMPWNQPETRKIVYTYQGRNAIALICKILAINSRDEVLVPAYNCGAEIDPFVRTGAKTILYRIDEKLKLDMGDIMRRTTPSTKIIYVTHFFGWPQEIDVVADWCKNKNIFLIEDCAQALFNQGSNNAIGQKGDAAIYSFVKTLPTPDGGALVIDSNIWKDGIPEIRWRGPETGKILHGSIPLFKKWFMNSNTFWQNFDLIRNVFIKSWRVTAQRTYNQSRQEMLKSNYFIDRQIYWTMSRSSRGLVHSANIHAIIEKRRKNFLFLNTALRKIRNFEPLFHDLPDSVCPMAFPFIIKRRREWTAQLNSRGILVQGWPGYYPKFNWDDYPEACNLKDNLLWLPVHQYLNLHHMHYIAECVKGIAEGMKC